MAPTPAVSNFRDSDLLQSGASLGRKASARAGFVPLPLEHVVLEGLASIPVYLRTLAQRGDHADYQFTLYSSPATHFAEPHRARLRDAGVKFIYISLQNHMQFRRQVENHLENVVADPGTALSTKSELIYETSVELVDELLTEQGLGAKLPRLGSICKAVTTLIMNDAAAFSHLFAASQHDFYTATHMVNVGTWMVPLAYALGIESMDELNLMCMAGMVHDIGKIFVHPEVLNKRGALTEQDWRQLRAHPMLGANHLRQFDQVPEMVVRVAAEHHERTDGSGYPAGLRGDQMHLGSHICAVVDSFDAMTAFRPFKDKTHSFGAALAVLQAESFAKYDPRIVETWIALMQRAEKDGAIAQPLQAEAPQLGRRTHERFPIQCPARVHRMTLHGGSWIQLPAVQVTAHSISHSGLGFLSPQPVEATHYVRIHLMGTGNLANRTLDGQVVRCREYSAGWHEIGLRFASLGAEQRSANAAAAQSAAPAESFRAT